MGLVDNKKHIELLEKDRERSRLYRLNNPEKRKETLKKYYHNNKEKEKLRHKEYNSKPENKEKIRIAQRNRYKLQSEKECERKRLWRKNNPEKYKKIKQRHKNKNPELYKQKVRNNYRKKYDSDILFRIACVLRASVKSALKHNYKKGKTLELLGCSVFDLKKHLEYKFTPEMNWDNCGKYWEIDHIVPCTAWDLSKEEAQKKCFHYSNQQPLNGTENVKKYNHINLDLIKKMDSKTISLLTGKWKIAAEKIHNV